MRRAALMLGAGCTTLLTILSACGDDEDPATTSSSSGDGGGTSSSSSSSSSSGSSSSSSGANDASGNADSDLPPLPSGCAPLPAPAAGATIVNVTPAQANDLPTIVQNAAPNTTIMLADGTYKMTANGEASRRLQFLKPNVTLRSKSNNRDAVTIDAEYKTNEAIVVAASNVTIAHITVTHAIDHPIHVMGGAAANTDKTVLYDLHVVDGGEQQIKVNTSGAAPNNTFVDNGQLECSLVELTSAGRSNVETLGGTSCYTGGIDAHQARGWSVRNNTFRGIYCDQKLAEHAIHFWNGSRDTLVERNTIIECARGIGFGLLDAGTSRQYADNPYPGIYVGHYDGIIRNNFIAATIAAFDTGIELDQARGTKVHHNTVFHPATAFSSIDRRFANTQAELRNNLVVKLTTRDGAGGTAMNNLEGATAALFVDGPKGDLHLKATATTAIDKAAVLTDPGLDIDGKPHGATPDLGADEQGVQ